MSADMTSTHGAWRHAGARFLLSGGQAHAAVDSPCVVVMLIVVHVCCRCTRAAAVCLQTLSKQDCRGESGWCSDMTSSHGAWRHAGIRFLFSGELWRPAKCTEEAGMRFQHEGRGESGWCSDMTSTHGAWRHAGIRFLLSGELWRAAKCTEQAGSHFQHEGQGESGWC